MPLEPLISRLKRLAGNRSRDAIGRPTAAESMMDVVVKSALQKGILTPVDVNRVSWDGSVAVDWRVLCKSLEGGQTVEGGRSRDADSRQADRDRADMLRRFAAELYGFQSIVVCEVGTLVLAHMLRRQLSPEIWRECFRLDCIPVAPHGKSLSSSNRLMLASPDPARAAVRNLSRSAIPGESTLVYADASVLSALKTVLVNELQFVASAVANASDGAGNRTVPAGPSTSSYPEAA